MECLSGRLAELVSKLDALCPSLSLASLAHALEGAKLSPADVAAYIHSDERSYYRGLVVRREHYELLVMTWLPGQASVPHDHTGSICAMQVVQGEAIEGCYLVAPDGYVDLEYETRVRCGEVTAGQDAGVHTVRNPSATGDLLVTVHVYAPPLKDIRRFLPRPDVVESHGTNGYETPTVVVVGGGFSGSMTAAQLLRGAGGSGTAVRVVLVERRGTVGEGVAYSTREPCHLLNVAANRMSAWPDRPNDFLEWAEKRHGQVAPGDFLPRQWYGAYVRELLHTAARAAGPAASLSVVMDEVRRVARHPAGGWLVHLGQGASLRAGAVVLAVGHRPPSDPIGPNWSGPRTRFLADPWGPDINAVGPDDAAVILGSGLTAVDTVLCLAQRQRRAPITLISRHGLLPQAHTAAPPKKTDLQPLVSELLARPGGVHARLLLRKLRQTVRDLAGVGMDWRPALDALRPHTVPLWQAMPVAQRRRFLRHLRPFWEIHRHRMAPCVAERFHTMIERGEVRVVAGRVLSAHTDGRNVQLLVRQRRCEKPVELHAGWVINCTGPMPSNSVESNPAVGSLLVHHWLQPDELALGVQTDANGVARAASGHEVPDLFVVGTLRKPALWESTAVPELREQAATVARQVLSRLGPGCAQPELARQTVAPVPNLAVNAS